MSRNIPPVRTWSVKYWRNGVRLEDLRVFTINKRFARWEARDQLLALPDGATVYTLADRVTVSLVRKPNMCR